MLGDHCGGTLAHLEIMCPHPPPVLALTFITLEGGALPHRTAGHLCITRTVIQHLATCADALQSHKPSQAAQETSVHVSSCRTSTPPGGPMELATWFSECDQQMHVLRPEHPSVAIRTGGEGGGKLAVRIGCVLLM